MISGNAENIFYCTFVSAITSMLVMAGMGESESKLGLESTRVAFFERLGLDSDSGFWRR